MRLYAGDCLEVMPTLEAESIDAVVTDPPYGLKFMGKDWDYGVPGVHFWTEVLRVAKPGCHLLAFGGTRTFHRLAVAIEDAGWEIRDTLMWVYGSGFPKSLDVSKAIDKMAGAEREVVGYKIEPNGRCRRDEPKAHDGEKSWAESAGFTDSIEKRLITAPATDLARQWSGFGTALKPATEYIICAQKPLHLSGLCGILALKIKEAICQLSSNAKAAGTGFPSNQNAQGGVCDSALWSAVEGCSTLEDLYALMDTLPLGSVIPTTLNTALSWLNILGAISQAESTFTTEMVSGLITDLKILNSSPSPITPDAIIEAVTGQRGIGSNASLAASIFNVVAAKLSSILTPSALGLVTSRDGEGGLRPDWRPIIMARKPLIGTVAENVLKYGTGAINVDGCRVESELASGRTRHGGGIPGNGSSFELPDSHGQMPSGRWPANLIHDGSEEVLELFPQSKSTGGSGPASKNWRGPKGRFMNNIASATGGFGDSGSAARFFYCAKASKSDRGNGNGHPTVKPTALMRYLCKLVTPPDGTILDPFMGSGSTGKAALLEGFDFIGIDSNPEYVEIAKARISHERP